MANSSSMLCATYLCMSVAVIFIVVGAMWDSFVNAPIHLVVYDNGVEQFAADATVGLVQTDGKKSEAILCAASGQGRELTTLFATIDSFRGIFPVDDARLVLFNKRGAVCLTFSGSTKLQDFTAAFMSVHRAADVDADEKDEEAGPADDLTESEVFLAASDIMAASGVEAFCKGEGEGGWDFCA